VINKGPQFKRIYLKILSKSLNINNSSIDKYAFKKALTDKRKAYREQMEQAIYTISNGKCGIKHDWVFKINETNTFGKKSRKKINKIINEDFGIEYNDEIPEMFKRVIWE
jgi:hypothetical protein